MSEPLEDYDLIDLRSPIVEERLYSSLLCLSCLKRLALLAATERENMQMVNHLPAFAWMARRFVIARSGILLRSRPSCPQARPICKRPYEGGSDDDVERPSSRLVGATALADDAAPLAAADAAAAKLLRHHGVLYSREAREAVSQLTQPTTHPSIETTSRSAYYLGLQVGWRVAQRLR